MQSVLLDAQERVLELKEESLTLRAENAKLKEQLAAKTHVTFDRGAFTGPRRIAVEMVPLLSRAQGSALEPFAPFSRVGGRALQIATEVLAGNWLPSRC